MELGRVPARPHPRSPASNIVIGGSGILTRGWHLRLWAPFSCLLTSSSFCPSSAYRESLGHRSSRSAPSTPFIQGSPAALASGLRAGATSRRSLFGRRSDGSLSIAPPGAAPVGPGEVQERHLPHPGGHDAAVPRRLSSVPLIPLPAPPGLSPQGLGNRDRLWETVTACPGGPVSHEAGRLTDLVNQYYTLRHSTSDSVCLYNVKNHKT